MEGMVDIHTHVLPGVDDGPDQLQEALSMAVALQRDGVRTAVCTPHFDPGTSSLEEFLQRRTSALAEMKEAPIELIPASETLLHKYLFHYSDLEALCIKNTRYLLLELPFYMGWEEETFRFMERLRNYYNIIPVIAHIERYPRVSSGTAARLRALDCCIQLNASSILSPGRRRRAMHYLKKGYIDVIGSDCHNLLLRPPCLSEAYERIRAKLGEEVCAIFYNNSQALVNGVELRKGK
ncbi:tyrosine-protein phosphatase [Anaerotaenia torta]|uniref:tyrosine-protein phosphatase n=1 Tax=Anaerotaenia torta TaxID=433293 RepID=UPI003D2517AF